MAYNPAEDWTDGEDENTLGDYEDPNVDYFVGQSPAHIRPSRAVARAVHSKLTSSVPPSARVRQTGSSRHSTRTGLPDTLGYV